MIGEPQSTPVVAAPDSSAALAGDSEMPNTAATDPDPDSAADADADDSEVRTMHCFTCLSLNYIGNPGVNCVSDRG